MIEAWCGLGTGALTGDFQGRLEMRCGLEDEDEDEDEDCEERGTGMALYRWLLMGVQAVVERVVVQLCEPSGFPCNADVF